MITESLFKEVAASESNINLSKRNGDLYQSKGDIRSEFTRDYNRVLHSYAYRRLKHKTQVFFNGAGNDHVCTRIEHVQHVESVASTIALKLGLNLELVRAIAIAHDLGHAPFGHHGEKILTDLRKPYSLPKFWHEKNGLYFADNIELLKDHQNIERNLCLTYAVRDGIISHCGEVDENGLKPRDEYSDLYNFNEAGKFEAVSWEGCVVKLADKIAYLGRDIEDATELGYFGDEEKKILKKMSRNCMEDESINTSTIMHRLIIDLCEHSNPNDGLSFSDDIHEVLKQIKKFNYTYIYDNKRLNSYKNYAKLVINEIWDYLMSFYNGSTTFDELKKDQEKKQPKKFVGNFYDWLIKYCDEEIVPDKKALENLENIKVYGKLENKEMYAQAISDYIAGMTDNFAVSAFNELLQC